MGLKLCSSVRVKKRWVGLKNLAGRHGIYALFKIPLRLKILDSGFHHNLSPQWNLRNNENDRRKHATSFSSI
jgi:hypothetical protein